MVVTRGVQSTQAVAVHQRSTCGSGKGLVEVEIPFARNIDALGQGMTKVTERILGQEMNAVACEKKLIYIS